MKAVAAGLPRPGGGATAILGMVIVLVGLVLLGIAFLFYPQFLLAFVLILGGFATVLASIVARSLPPPVRSLLAVAGIIIVAIGAFLALASSGNSLSITTLAPRLLELR